VFHARFVPFAERYGYMKNMKNKELIKEVIKNLLLLIIGGIIAITIIPLIIFITSKSYRRCHKRRWLF